MANPGVGNRFVPVNLNKSYGQSTHPNQSNSNNYGSGRGRSHGGSMVVLSRPRSSHKAGPKLSIPPPLNLPSIRKEHEKFDSLGSGSGSVGGGVTGSGARPSSSGMGWSKPSAIVPVERDGVVGGGLPLSSDGVVDGVNTGVTTAYTPPSVRSGTFGPDSSAHAPVVKTSVLRGEDFPSLRATLTAASGPTHKQKDSANKKQRQGISEEPSGGLRESSHVDSHIAMRPHMQSSQHSVSNDRDMHNSSYTRPSEQGRKQNDYFPSPLPLVRLSPRSDWADDERDTSHGLRDRGRDNGFSRIEAYWDGDFDLPTRKSFLPHKPAQSHFDKRGQHDNDVGKRLTNEVSKADPFSRDARAPSREDHQQDTWRSPVSTHGFASLEVVSDTNTVGARPTSVYQETNKENKYIPPQFEGSTRDERNGGVTIQRDFSSGRRDHGYVQGGRQQRNNSLDANGGRVVERNIRDHYGTESNGYKINAVQNNVGSRSSLPAGSKGFSGSDHLTNFGRDKRSFSRGEKPYVEDPYLKDWDSTGYDGQDPFSGGILGVVKRKKDANKQVDFHDPVRESFEAELERVQRIQEQERQRVVEEQERAMEMARREEEERQRVAREQEERQRRLVEEAREASWRAEQERLEAIRRAEELRIAREEEKERMLMEEERRKQAAKQKLIELEERMARRQAEAGKAESSGVVDLIKERDDFSGWEDGERMVERITNSASSDSSLSRSFDMGSRVVSVREGSFSYTQRGQSFNSWRRGMFDNGNNSSIGYADHENGHLSPRRDTSLGGRAFPRKDFYGGAGYMPTRGYHQGGLPESHVDGFPHARGDRWNVSGDGDFYGTSPFPENHESVSGKFDMGWGQGRSRGNSPFPENIYHNPELDELYNYGRSRYPARQPRVLPPPSLPLVHRTSFRDESERALQNESDSMKYQHVHEQRSDILVIEEQSATNGEQEVRRSATPGHDSQSSLCVSSPPSSPTPLSHDDLDESRDSLAAPCIDEGQVDDEAGKGNTITAASSISLGDDEEWSVENNEELQEQEEYDEDVGYHEDDEVHEGDDENVVELSCGMEEMHLEGKDTPRTMENLVLGFDQGVEVGITNDECENSPRESSYVGPQVTDVQETESINASHTSTALDPTQQMVSSPVGTNSQSSSQAVMPSVASTLGPAELPVKLQFGLFSGPSLIPSPVPAIQIGSIQMPLQFHPQIGSMHAPQPPLFQFGQLRYPSPISQGISPLTPHSVSFVQPNVPPSYASSQRPGGPLSVQPVQDSSAQSSVKDDGLPLISNNHHIQFTNQLNVCQDTQSGGSNALMHQNLIDVSSAPVDQGRLESCQQDESVGPPYRQMRSSKSFLNNKASVRRSQVGLSSSHSAANLKDASGSSAERQLPGSKGRRFAFTARNPGTRYWNHANEASRSDSNGFHRKPRRGTQRFEFRVRQTGEGKQSSALNSSNSSNYDGLGSGTPSAKSTQIVDSRIPSSDQIITPEGKPARKESSTSGLDTSRHVEGSLKRNISSEQNVDAPLQSGIVHVFKQPGIEAPSDEDDFIEVKSKRQMLNVRREQREKEIKAQTSSFKKAQQKSRPPPNSTTGAGRTSKSIRTAVTSKRGLVNNEVSAAFNNIGSHPLAPIGTPFINDCQADAQAQTTKPPQTSREQTVGSDLTSDAKSKVLDGVQSSSGSWGNSRVDQPVMALTQTQLEEAMKPVQFDSHLVSVGDHTSSVSEPSMSSSSTLAKDCPFSSATSPICSLLAGQKIQFGAVTSPTILPPTTSTRVVSHGHGTRPPTSSQLDIQISQSNPPLENGSGCLFEKEKHSDESLEDCEAEAEAAASAVAVAAIGNDEVAGNGIASCSAAMSDSNQLNADMSGDGQAVSRSKAEETLSVSLPADLSVETPPMSLWPALPSPHTSSTQILSPFPGGPISHFPFYDMNPMMGGPVFAFGPHDQSSGLPSQPQKSSASSSGPLGGTWQQCHTGVDSFYGPPSGFTAPFISPPPGSSIPGVHGPPPQMVVYNHFAPVGQYGQVYMGTTYIPSGKQPDWKRNPTSSTVGGGDEVGISNLNVGPMQRNTPNLPAQVQHLAPGSPILSLPSTLPLFEVPPFQSSPDVSVHARWSHIQASSSLQSIPQSMPCQQQGEGAVQPQLSANGFSKPQSSSSVEVGRPFPGGFGLVDPPASAYPEASGSSASVPEGSGSKRNPQRTQLAQHKNPSGQQQHYSHYQRGGSQKNGSGAEWSNRKMGFHGRNHSSGGERGVGPPKVKQIYVAKQSTGGGGGGGGGTSTSV